MDNHEADPDSARGTGSNAWFERHFGEIYLLLNFLCGMGPYNRQCGGAESLRATCLLRILGPTQLARYEEEVKTFYTASFLGILPCSHIARLLSFLSSILTMIGFIHVPRMSVLPGFFYVSMHVCML